MPGRDAQIVQTPGTLHHLIRNALGSETYGLFGYATAFDARDGMFHHDAHPMSRMKHLPCADYRVTIRVTCGQNLAPLLDRLALIGHSSLALLMAFPLDTRATLRYKSTHRRPLTCRVERVWSR